MTHVFNTTDEAETAANEMYLVRNPQGTTERLYGWIPNPDGAGYVLKGMDERWQLVDGKWAFVEPELPARPSLPELPTA